MTKAPPAVPAAVLGKLADVQTGIARAGTGGEDPYKREDLKNDLDELFAICAECGGIFDADEEDDE